MIAVVAFVLGAAVTAVLWRLLEPSFAEAATTRRTNYRGVELPVGTGVVIVLAAVVLATGYALWIRVGGITPSEAFRGPAFALGATVGFGLIGLLDDLVGGAATKGFRGHLGALAHGRVTTGLVKLVWGVLLGVLVVSGTVVDSLRGGLLVAAAANLANLFDRAPGRVVKVSLLGAVVVAACGGPAWQLTGPMMVLGGGAAMLVPDLRERCMLGDTGANVLGAAVGSGLVLALGATGQWIALAVVVALNLASERVSFSRVIDATAPLRWFDRLGATPERRRR